jgi:hypothetical protein
MAIDTRFMGRREAEETYKNTPTYPDPVRGHCLHMGDGVWATRCLYCDETHYSYGPIPMYASVGQHMVEAHSALIPGINVGMLPK